MHLTVTGNNMASSAMSMSRTTISHKQFSGEEA